MSDVLDRFRAKYNTEASDEDLTVWIGQNYPQYLEADPKFKADYETYSAPSYRLRPDRPPVGVEKVADYSTPAPIREKEAAERNAGYEALTKQYTPNVPLPTLESAGDVLRGTPQPRSEPLYPRYQPPQTPLQLRDPLTAIEQGRMGDRFSLAAMVPPVEKTDPGYEVIAKKAAQFGLSIPDFIGSQEGALTVIASLTPAGRAMAAGYWTPVMLKQAWETASQAIDGWDKLTPAQQLEASWNVAQSTAMGLLPLGLALGPKGRTVSPSALGKTVGKIEPETVTVKPLEFKPGFQVVGNEPAARTLAILEQAKQPVPPARTPVVLAQEPEREPSAAAQAVTAAGQQPAAVTAAALEAGKAAPDIAAAQASARAQEAVAKGREAATKETPISPAVPVQTAQPQPPAETAIPTLRPDVTAGEQMKGAGNAIQERGPAEVPLGEAPGNRPEVGARISEPGQAAEAPRNAPGQENLQAQGQAVKPISVESLQSEMGLGKPEAEATMALVDAMGLDKSKIEVAKGGEPAQGALLSVESFERGSWQPEFDRAAQAAGWKPEQIEQTKDMIQGVADIFKANPDVLPIEGSLDAGGKRLKALVENADFGVTLDVNRLCKRVTQYWATVNEVERKMGRPLGEQELLRMSQQMRADGDIPGCIYCYVEASRRAAQRNANAYAAKSVEEIRLEDETLGKKRDLVELAMRRDQLLGQLGWSRERMAKWLINKDAQQPLVNEARELIRAQWEKIAAQLSREGKTGKQIRKLYWKLAPETTAKALKSASPQLKLAWDYNSYVLSAKGTAATRNGTYMGEILGMTPEQVADSNARAGMRWLSATDLDPTQLVDTLQAMADSSVMGLAGHEYTKEPYAALIFGNSGMKINLSLAVTEKKPGVFVSDNVQGMPLNVAMRLRERFPNAGTMLMAKNLRQIEMGLARPDIDMMIPHHAANWSGGPELYGIFGLDDFSKVQHEHWLDKTKIPTDARGNNLSPKGAFGNKLWFNYWLKATGNNEKAAVKAYLDFCRQNNLRPKFDTGTYTSGETGKQEVFPGYTQHPGYAKLLKDYARTDSPQTALDVTRIDQKRLTTWLNQFIEGGGWKPKETPNPRTVEQFVRLLKSGEPLDLRGTEEQLTAQPPAIRGVETPKSLGLSNWPLPKERTGVTGAPKLLYQGEPGKPVGILDLGEPREPRITPQRARALDRMFASFSERPEGGTMVLPDDKYGNNAITTPDILYLEEKYAGTPFERALASVRRAVGAFDQTRPGAVSRYPSHETWLSFQRKLEAAWKEEYAKFHPPSAPFADTRGWSRVGLKITLGREPAERVYEKVGDRVLYQQPGAPGQPAPNAGLVPIKSLEEAMQAVLKEQKNEYAKSYAEGYLRSGDPNTILYVWGNLKGWRGPRGQQVRDYLMAASKRGPEKLYQGEVELTERQTEDANWDYLERNQRHAEQILEDFKAGAKRMAWKHIPAESLKKIWLEFGKRGSVSDVDGLKRIKEIVLDNIARLRAVTELVGHTPLDPEEIAADLEVKMTKRQWDRFYMSDYIRDEFSDSAFRWLDPLYEKIHATTDPAQLVPLIDRVLNVVHQRSDLAANFVEGGSKTLLDVSLQGGFRSPTEKVQQFDTWGRPRDLAQGPKGSVEFAEGGKALIRALQNPDVSTGVHEISHVARRFLLDRTIPQENRLGISDDHIRVAEQWAGAEGGKWTVAAEEKFARGFERYLRDGSAPNTTLAEVFAKFKEWLTKIYDTLTGSSVDLKISPQMRGVYDALVTRSQRLKAGEARPELKPRTIPEEAAPVAPTATAPATPTAGPGPESQRLYGIAQRIRDERAAAGQGPVIEPGQGVSVQETLDWGRQLKAAGADPEKVIGEFEATKRFGYDDMALVRAHGEDLFIKAAAVERQFGVESAQAKTAKAVAYAWDQRSKAMQTEWHKMGQAQQAATDLDTGSVVGLEREYRDITGNDFNPKQLRTATRLATQNNHALDAASRAVRNWAAESAKIVKAESVRQVTVGQEQARAAAEAGRKAVALADEVNRQAFQRLELARKKEAEASEKLKREREQMEVARQHRAAQAMQNLRTDAIIRAANAEAQKRVDAAARDLRLAEVERKRAERDMQRVAERVRKAAIKAAKAETWAEENPEKVVLQKMQEYLDQGLDDYREIRAKIATDLGLDPNKVTKLMAYTPRMKFLADEVWRKQQDVRKMQAMAKRWLMDQQVPGYERALAAIPRAMFSLKVGFHGTVALGTHAPMVAFQPRFWALYLENFIKMYRMVGLPTFQFERAKAFYEKEMYDLQRRPNYITARRAGLINDPFLYEEYEVPPMKQYIRKVMGDTLANKWDALTTMGNRGYSVLKIIRQDMFDQMWNQLPKTVKSDEMAAALADGINHATGVVQGKAPPGSNVALFAPRLMASRVMWLGGDPLRAGRTLAQGVWYKVTKDPRWKPTAAEVMFMKNQVKEKAWVTGTYLTLLAINQGILSALGSDQKINGIPEELGGKGIDALESDFMKFKGLGRIFSYGNAMMTMARFPFRTWASSFEESRWTKMRYPDETWAKAVGSYARTQASPFAGTVADLLFGRNFEERPLPRAGFGLVEGAEEVPKRLAAEGIDAYTWTEYWFQQLAMIPVQEMLKEVWEEGLGMSEEQLKAYAKAFFGTVIPMAGTGGRIQIDEESGKPIKPSKSATPNASLRSRLGPPLPLGGRAGSGQTPSAPSSRPPTP